MSSFYAELHLAGFAFPVLRCSYSFQQATDARGRVCAKVRHGPLQVLVDVPETDLLLAWTAAPFKPLAGQVVFYNDAQARQPRESISFAAGQCVGYEEDFDAGTGGGGNGAYVCVLTITAPAFELHSGGGPAVAAAHLDPTNEATLGLKKALLMGGSVIGSSSDQEDVNFPVVPNELPSLLEAAQTVNPSNGQENCTHITEALVARFHGIDATAIAPDAPARGLEELEASHNTSVEFGKNFQEAFQVVRDGGEGTIAIVVILPNDGGIGHVVTMINRDGTPTIVEGQNWGPGRPAEIITSLARAERRYGNEIDNMIGIGIVPPPPTASVA